MLFSSLDWALYRNLGKLTLLGILTLLTASTNFSLIPSAQSEAGGFKIKEGQGGLVCCSPWHLKELVPTWRLNSKTTESWLLLLFTCPVVSDSL